MGRRDRQLNCVTPLSGQTLPADYAWAAESAEGRTAHVILGPPGGLIS